MFFLLCLQLETVVLALDEQCLVSFEIFDLASGLKFVVLVVVVVGELYQVATVTLCLYY